MSQVGTALRLFALEDSTLADQLGQRLRPVHLEKEDEGQPVGATYNTISDTPAEGLDDGEAPHSETRIQYDVYADDDELAHAVAKSLRKRLRKAYGSLDAGDSETVFVTGCSSGSGVRDLSALAPVDGSSDWKHRLSFDMLAGYNPT